MNKNLHIVSFDVPYPPNYGGAIDVFYKLKALYNLGCKIHFHTFEYGRGKHKKIEEYCSSIYYYERNSLIKSFLSNDPFIVKSRSSNSLIHNLNKDDFPVLFEGLHTTFPIYSQSLKKNKKSYVRAHNIEHDFYKGLAKSESNLFKRNFFKQEAKKLKRYEKILHNVDGVFTISPKEQQYFQKKYGAKCIYIPAFHDSEIHTKREVKGNFILYHGNVSVSENVKAALFLIDVYKNSSYQLVIASSFINDEISKEIVKHKNIRFHSLTKEIDLNRLFENAHINVLPTFQNTGIKLKLLNTLYQGKFIIANDFMIDNTGLETLCEKANTKEEFLQKTEELLQLDFDISILEDRKKVLEDFSPKKSAKKIVKTIFG